MNIRMRIQFFLKEDTSLDRATGDLQVCYRHSVQLASRDKNVTAVVVDDDEFDALCFECVKEEAR